jgi:hypothetical protein
MKRQRLESEALRDSLLAAAGRLDLTSGGPAFRDLASPRRTVYLMTIRSDRGGYQPLFDAADPTGIAEKRIDSTVAPQALFLLNHPFVTEQAEVLAKRMSSEAPCDVPGRIRWLYELLYARAPAATELQLGEAALVRCEAAQITPDAAWVQYAHVLLCANEFVYID